MNAKEIIKAVEEGKTVNWINSGYEVQKWADGYNIVFVETKDAVGLFDHSGNLTEKEETFFIKE